jgi:uncharacterized membrane protein (DUF106 family)
LKKQLNLFLYTLVAIIIIYVLLFGEHKTIEIMKEEYPYILGLIPTFALLIFCKSKLRKYGETYTPEQHFSLKSTTILFFIFQAIDYYNDGLEKMITQWFFYWILGLIGLLLMQSILYYRVYKLVKESIEES